ncbi:MAG: heme-binding protein [Bryobacteraceae bacterium]|nr:heme-binding protein [Bryobacteraceae bacterium]
MTTRIACTFALAATLPIAAVFADDDPKDRRNEANSTCSGLPTSADLKTRLKEAPATGGDAGGLFGGARMWGAIVNRDGELCALATSTDDPKQVWPGSQAIAKSKAYTANAFSLDNLALSTARLYTLTQPGHSLWSLGQSNLFDTKYLNEPQVSNEGKNQIPGGLIFFGGGVALYKNGKVIGGLGISGDTSCADHEIAKRVRTLLGLNPTAGPATDDITYSAADGASVFTHPLCVNTWRNGVFIGNEKVAAGY